MTSVTNRTIASEKRSKNLKFKFKNLKDSVIKFVKETQNKFVLTQSQIPFCLNTLHNVSISP